VVVAREWLGRGSHCLSFACVSVSAVSVNQLGYGPTAAATLARPCHRSKGDGPSSLMTTHITKLHGMCLSSHGRVNLPAPYRDEA
jgi:hypothetical protein